MSELTHYPATASGERCTLLWLRFPGASASSKFGDSDHLSVEPELCPVCRAEQAEARVKKLEKWHTAVLSIVDSLDDPYRGNSWQEVTQELCARELEHLRSVLVSLVRGEEER